MFKVFAIRENEGSATGKRGRAAGTLLISLLLALTLGSGAALLGCSSDEGANGSNDAQAQDQEVVDDNASLNEETITVNVLVDSSAAEEAGYPSSMAEGGYTVAAGSSAYDALVATALPLTGSPSFVEAIDTLGMNAVGTSAGWMYEVNGESPAVAADEYILEDGDSVRWYYSVQ